MEVSFGSFHSHASMKLHLYFPRKLCTQKTRCSYVGELLRSNIVDGNGRTTASKTTSSVAECNCTESHPERPNPRLRWHSIEEVSSTCNLHEQSSQLEHSGGRARVRSSCMCVTMRRSVTFTSIRPGTLFPLCFCFCDVMRGSA